MDADFDAIRAVWRRISGGGDAKAHSGMTARKRGTIGAIGSMRNLTEKVKTEIPD
jgi:hypothetical protein